MKKRIISLIIISVFIVLGCVLFSQPENKTLEIEFLLKKDGTKEYIQKELLFNEKFNYFELNEKLSMRDNYRIIVTSKTDGFLTIFNVNPKNEWVKLYPFLDKAVKIKADKEYKLPIETNDSFTFDESSGREIMFFVFGEREKDVLHFSGIKKGVKVLMLFLQTEETDDENIDEIIFKDENFEDAVRELIGKKILPVKKSDVEKIEEIIFTDKDIEYIDGIEHFKNLKKIMLDYNDIKSIESLSSLTKLKHLDLQGNKIKDIGVLKGLTNLTYLNLTENFVNDITTLQHLQKLEQLLLYRNQISDLSPIEDLTNLERLSLPLNRIDEISSLKKLYNLKELYLHTNEISDVSSLEDLTKLEVLHLSYNDYIEDISPLSELTELKELYLYENDIVDITPLSNMNKLTKLVIGDNDIEDISTLKTIYENGGLQRGSELIITNNNMNLRPYSDNREIVNFLIGKGVIIEYEKGNNIR